MVGLRQWIWSDASVSLSLVQSGVKVVVRKRSQHTTHSSSFWARPRDMFCIQRCERYDALLGAALSAALLGRQAN
eukprot:779075-Heterocapsa_arctica.AAC.1